MADVHDTVFLDDALPRGYGRTPEGKSEFDAAVARIRETDGWPTEPGPGQTRRLIADLALEGGGVKGIGLVGAVMVLDEAGYEFRGVAGTSAGAIVASLIAGLSATDRVGLDMTALRGYMKKFSFAQCMPEGWLHKLFDHLGRFGQLAADGAILLRRPGIYPGTYVEKWLHDRLHGDLGIDSFAKLHLPPEKDDDPTLPPERRYRLVVHTADITRGQLVRLPWDYRDFYGHTADEEDPVHAVRASMSIPFFFEPVSFATNQASVDLPDTGGGTTTVTHAPGTVPWVDGGLLENFPIDAFDRMDGKAPRWPTIGIKLSQLQTDYPATEECASSVDVAWRCIETLLNEWNSYAVDEATAARTIYVDTDQVKATDFNLRKEQQDSLFRNGVIAATNFLIEMGEKGHVPRTSGEALQWLSAKRGSPDPTRRLSPKRPT